VVGDTALTLGIDGTGAFVERIPIPVTRELLLAGRLRYERICATCHGTLGDGVSEVAEKMPFVKPVSFHDPGIRAYPPGRIFQVVSFGYGLMPSFSFALTIEERWAVVAYVRALQRSQNASLAELPPRLRRRFESEVR
jgi:mono/diheme cytochrome c family protein